MRDFSLAPLPSTGEHEPTSHLTTKTLDHNVLFYKLVLKESKKRKTNQTLTFRVQQEPTVEENEDAFWTTHHNHHLVITNGTHLMH